MTRNTASTTEDLGPTSPRAKSDTTSTTELWEQSEELIPRMEKKAALLEDDLLRKQVIRLGFLLDSLRAGFERMKQERDEAVVRARFNRAAATETVSTAALKAKHVQMEAVVEAAREAVKVIPHHYVNSKRLRGALASLDQETTP